MKKSELKSYIEEEIVNELTMVDKNTKPEEVKDEDPKTVKTAIDQAKKTGLPVNIAEDTNSDVKKIAIRSLSQFFRVSPQALSSFKFDGSDDIPSLTKALNSTSDEGTQGYYEVAIKLAKEEAGEGDDLNEMAKISGDLKSTIDKVMDSNPEADITSLKKTIQSDEAVLKALAGSKLHDTQLAKFISATKGEREIGKRGPKVDPNKPKPEPKAPKKAVDPRNKKTKLTTSKIDGRKYYSKGEDDEEGPSDLELRKLAKSGGGKIEKSKISLLQQQERTKLIKDFLAGLKKFGIIDNANRIIDKEKYDKAWEVEKEAIRKQVEKLK
jgi:hypothetical protein